MIGDCPDAEEKLNGFESDLVWFMDGAKVRGRKVYEFPRDTLLERTGHKGIGDTTAADVTKLRAWLDEMRLAPDFLLPIEAGQRYNNSLEPLREDGYYQWIASQGSRVKIGKNTCREVVTLRFRSLPDEEEVDFVPGVGLVRMKYRHKGTVTERYLRLVRHRLAPL